MHIKQYILPVSERCDKSCLSINKDRYVTIVTSQMTANWQHSADNGNNNNSNNNEFNSNSNYNEFNNSGPQFSTEHGILSRITEFACFCGISTLASDKRTNTTHFGRV